MTQSRCPHRGLPAAPLPLQIKATNWPSADEIDAYNDDLIMAIIEVIAVNMIPTENHLISLGKFIESNCGKKDGSSPLLSPGRCTREEEGEEP